MKSCKNPLYFHNFLLQMQLLHLPHYFLLTEYFLHFSCLGLLYLLFLGSFWFLQWAVDFNSSDSVSSTSQNKSIIVVAPIRISIELIFKVLCWLLDFWCHYILSSTHWLSCCLQFSLDFILWTLLLSYCTKLFEDQELHVAHFVKPLFCFPLFFNNIYLN